MAKKMYICTNQNTEIMSEENVKNPMDLNGDGKVTFGEKVQYTAGKAAEKVEEAVNKVYDGVKEDAKDALEDAKKLYGKASEKAKDLGDKAKDVYSEAADKAKDAYKDAKEDLAEAAGKAKAKIQEMTDKKA